MFLIAMISLTMSRISSRAEFGVEARELREVDGLDQRAENRAFGLVIGFRSPGIDCRSVRRLAATLAAVGGADTSGAPSPSDGNGVRPVSMAGGDSAIRGAVGMATARRSRHAPVTGTRASEFPLRLPNRTPTFQAACFNSGHQA